MTNKTNYLAVAAMALAVVLVGAPVHAGLAAGATTGGPHQGPPTAQSPATDADLQSPPTAQSPATDADLQSPPTAQSPATDADLQGPEFVSSFLRQQRGDLVRITVRLDGTSSARVQLFTNEGDYERTLGVRDGNNDGRVTILFNTYRTGNDDAFRAKADIDEVQTYGGTAVGGPLPTGDYRLSLRQDGTGVDQMELEITERSTDGVRTLVAPEGADEELTSAAAVDDAAAAGTLSARGAGVDDPGEVAIQDVLVVELQASGLSGALDHQPGENTTAQFRSLVASRAVDLRVVQSNPRTSQRTARLLLNESGVHVVADERADAYYLVVDTSEAHFRRGQDGALRTGFDVGMAFDVEFTVRSAGNLAAEDEQVAGGFEVVSRDVTVEFSETQREADHPFLAPAEGQVVGGTTTLAPGSPLTVHLRNESDDGALARDVRVVEDGDRGSFAAQFDLSHFRDGTGVDVDVTEPAGRLDHDPVRAVVNEPAAAVKIEGQTVEGGTVYMHVNATLTRGGFVAVRVESQDGRLLGSTFVEPGTREVAVPMADLPAESTRLVVVAYRDLDDDRQFSPAADSVYETNTGIVRDVGILNERPASPTADPPSETPPTATTEPPTSDPGTGTDGTPPATSPSSPTSTSGLGPEQLPTPGFGPGLALAVLAAVGSLLARRS